ncbi:MAG: precorrin-6y C5,15-methyltransferase (decarboxylating) subunit CbiE [Phormidesmis sp.]
MSTPIIHVVGIGMAGEHTLAPQSLKIIQSATLLIGGRRHLSSCQNLIREGGIEALPLGAFSQVFEDVRSHCEAHADPNVVILASGDPLFFGVGRLLLAHFPAKQLNFHPHVSSIQLAFSRLKLPWQNATLLSVHGRSSALLIKALKRGDEVIALLTDGVMTPSAIASLLVSLDIPVQYRLWVCENLGDVQERVSDYCPEQLKTQPIDFEPLNVVVLQRRMESLARPTDLPLIGLPDSVFKGFLDRPTLMTKREIRLLVLGELAPLGREVIWDIGAGTGAVSVELSRLCPNATLYAIEKTAMGAALIKENSERLAAAPIHVIQGKAPDALHALPAPHRVFIGGSSGQLTPILNYLSEKPALMRIVLALATLDSLTEVTNWLKDRTHSETWDYRLTQVNISRSLPVGPFTRFSPLTPITLVNIFSKRCHAIDYSH